MLQTYQLVVKRNPSLQGSLRLRAWSGYLRRFVKKGSRQNPGLVSRDQLTNMIHNPRSRPKGALSHKIPWSYSYLGMGGSLYGSIKSSRVGIWFTFLNSLFRSSGFQIIPNSFSAIE